MDTTNETIGERLTQIPTPDGKPTLAKTACVLCGSLLPLRWYREVRRSGVLVYPMMDVGRTDMRSGRPVCKSCCAKAVR